MAPCDLMATARTVVEMMRVRAVEKKLSLVYHCTPEVPWCVRMDAPRLRQILINLLGNAIKFTKAGSVNLRLSATPANEPVRATLFFEVEDSGAGIPPQDLDRIFEPFEQLRKPGEPAGTGLGLTITRRFVEMIGGTLRVHSKVGQGSCFTVELPVELAREAELDGVDMAQGHTFLLEHGQAEYRVLIVEDDADNAVVLQQMLTRAGFQVRTAENGALGVVVFQEWHPHFIWMDLGMPQLNGMEATRRIRALDGGTEVKVVAITASAYASDREAVIRAGFDDFTLKPFRPADIFGCMERQMGVRYRSSATAGSARSNQPDLLRPAALAALPRELLRRLKGAVIALNTEQIKSLIEDVGGKDEALGQALQHLGNRYAYTAILTAIEREEQDAVPRIPGAADSCGAA